MEKLTESQENNLKWLEDFSGAEKEVTFSDVSNISDAMNNMFLNAYLYFSSELDSEDRINELIEIYKSGYKLILND